MSDIASPTSPELLQARAAAFVAENPLDDGSAPTFPQRLADIALGAAENIVLSPAQEEAMDEFLRSRGPDYAPIRRREELLYAYADFAPVVDPLADELRGLDADARRAHPAYLDEGYRCGVFKIVNGGQEYAVRVPWSPGTPDTDPIFSGIDKNYVQAGLRTRGVDSLEQLVAASFGKNVTVSEIMPGDNLHEIDPEELEDVTEAQLAEFVDTLTYIHFAGLSVDARPPNFFYDREKGFGVIDMMVRRYGLDKSSSPYRKTEDEILAGFLGVGAVMLGGIGSRKVFAEPETRAELNFRRHMVDVAIPMLEKYAAICRERFSGPVAVESGKKINAELVSTLQERERYEEWAQPLGGA